jgi:hypothetical protein
MKLYTGKEYQPPIEHMDVVVQVTLLLGIVCSIAFGVGTTGATFIMNTLSLLLYITFKKPNGMLSATHENVMKQIPATIASALSKFQLDAKTVVYAVCGCHTIYPPTHSSGSSIPVYPARCLNSPMPETQCTDTLLETGTDGKFRPKETFVYHDFKDYLANLLSRADIEVLMDSTCDDLCASLSTPPHLVKIPFEAQFLREFRGADPKKLFVDQGEEGCYAFTLHVNFFNLEGMSL